MRVEARYATNGDIASLVRLAGSASEEKLGQRGGELWEEFERADYTANSALQLAIADASMLIAVGTIDDAVIGFCAARLKQPRRPGRPIAQLDAIFVDSEAREVGVGESLMSLVLDWADEKGCRGVDSIALPGDRSTKNFFESFGLVARAIQVHRSL